MLEEKPGRLGFLLATPFPKTPSGIRSGLGCFQAFLCVERTREVGLVDLWLLLCPGVGWTAEWSWPWRTRLLVPIA